MVNSRDIESLRPDVRENVKMILHECDVRGLPVLITSTLRDQEYQTKLYAQGRTVPGAIVTNAKLIGFHGYGLAFDFCRNVRGREYDDTDGFFSKVAAIAKSYGFSWGGDWRSFPDKPHLQWDGNGNYSTTMLRNGKLPPLMPKREGKMMETYKTLNDVPAWGRITVKKLLDNGYLRGDGSALNLSYEFVRVFVVLDRMGLIPD